MSIRHRNMAFCPMNETIVNSKGAMRSQEMTSYPVMLPHRRDQLRNVHTMVDDREIAANKSIRSNRRISTRCVMIRCQDVVIAQVLRVVVSAKETSGSRQISECKMARKLLFL